MARPQADLFHPLTSLEWQRELYSVLSFNMLPVQAAVLDGELYVLGKKSAQSRHIEPRSYVYALARHGQGGSEIRSPLPTRRSAFTAYQDKLVLVGGIDATGLTGKIHCLQKPLEYNSQWINDDVKLPPMRTPRCGAAVLSIGQHLLVAGGEGFDGAMTAVEVFNGKEWRPTLSLPKEGKDMTSTVLNGKWILMGGTLGRSVFCANIDGLIQCGGWWKELPEAPLEKSCATVFGNHLLAIGGKQPSLSPSDVEGEEDSAASTASSTGSTAIYAYHPDINRPAFIPDDTPLWLHVEDLPAPTHSACAALLPSGELVVAVYNKDPQRRWHDFTVYKLLLRVDPFPEGKLSLRVLENFQHTAKIYLFRSIGAEWQRFNLYLTRENLDRLQEPSISSEERGKVVVKSWLKYYNFHDTTWKSLLQLLESLQQLEIVATVIKQYFSVAALEERVQHLEQSRDEVLQREKDVLQKEKDVLERDKEALQSREEALQKQSMMAKDIEELKCVIEPLLKKRDGRGEEEKCCQVMKAERDAALTKVSELEALVADLRAQLAKMHQKATSTAAMDRSVGELTDHEGADSVPSLLSPPEPRKTIPAGPKAPASKRRTEDDNGDAESHPKKRQRSQEVKHVDDSRAHQQQSHELAVFLKMRTSIRTGILPNIRNIAHIAFARGLIPKDTQRAITGGQMSDDVRTDRFLEGLEPKIRLDGTCLMKFVEVLRQSDPAYHDTLIKDITKALSSPSS